MDDWEQAAKAAGALAAVLLGGGLVKAVLDWQTARADRPIKRRLSDIEGERTELQGRDVTVHEMAEMRQAYETAKALYLDTIQELRAGLAECKAEHAVDAARIDALVATARAHGWELP